MYFDEEKYIAWEGEAARWILEKNDIVVEKAGRLKYPFSGLGTNEKNWSARLLSGWIEVLRYSI